MAASHRTVPRFTTVTAARVTAMPINILKTHEVRCLFCSVRLRLGSERRSIVTLDVATMAAYAPTADVASMMRTH